MLESEHAEGFTRGRALEKIGLHAQDTSEPAFDDVFVPDDHLLGGAGRGFEQLMHQLAWERLIIALDAAVGIERALDLTVAFVRERRSEEHTSELKSLMRNSYAVFCLKNKNTSSVPQTHTPQNR